jgi:tyrosine-protein kinase Etk/Wzc
MRYREFFMPAQTISDEITRVVPGESNEIDALDLLIVIAKKKRMIVFSSITAALVGAVISLLIPKLYTSMTRLLPPQQTQSSAVAMLAQFNPLASAMGKELGIKNPSDIYIGILRSRTVQDALINKFDLRKVYRYKTYQDTRLKLEDRSDIKAGKEGIITVAVQDRDPARAAEIANAYVSELIRVTQSLAVGEASQRRLFFERQVNTAKGELADAEVNLRVTQEKTGLIQLEGQAKAIIESAAILKAQIAAKRVQLDRMRLFAAPQNPDLLGAEQELVGLQQQLSVLEQKQSGNGDIQVATSKVPAAGLEYIRRYREVKYREAVFELLAKQYEAAKLDEAKNAAIIQVVDNAVKPEKKSSPKRWLIITLATVLGFCASCAWVLAQEIHQKLLSNPIANEKVQVLRQYIAQRMW